MQDLEILTRRIEGDENSVRDSNIGRGRLLDDLRQVPPDQVRNILSRVIADDKSMGKQPVIDMAEGMLIITDPFKAQNAGKAPEAKAEVATPAAPQGKGFLGTVKEIHDGMSWYEKLIVEVGALWELGQLNGIAKRAVDHKNKN